MRQLTMEEARSLARAGMARLDQYYGHEHWDAHVNVNTLRINSPEDCMLGQLFCGYKHGKDKLGLQNVGENSAAELGFALPVPAPDTSEEALPQFAILTQAWRVEILLRRGENSIVLPHLPENTSELVVEDPELVCV